MKQTLLRQARLIRIQWAIIFALLAALVIIVFYKIPAAAMATGEAPAQSSFTPVTVPAIPVTAVEPESNLAPDFELELEPELEIAYDLAPISLGEFKLTAYCPCEQCCGKSEESPYYGITAYGYTATAGRTIAVDPNIIPIGSEVIINGRTYVAEDVGGAIRENRIDIYFNTHQEALEFGIQCAEVFINNF